jgi:Ca-activated chloride channel family protein
MTGASEGSGPRVDPLRAKPSTAGSPIRVDVNLALVPVTVVDPMGRNVLGLAQSNFRVLDGSQQRPIVSFSSEDAPISVGLVFDCSKSMTDKFKISRQAPGQLFAQLNPNDEAFLITVSDRAVPRLDFTSDFTQIQNSLLFTHPDGSTSLLDGVYLGLEKLKQAHNPRKALIVVSDGGDNNSRYSIRELSSLAVESDAQIFSICLSFDPRTTEEVRGPVLLDNISEMTGGLRFMTTDASQMAKAMARIGVTLHHEYVLGIVPPPAAPQGKFRRIKVQVVVPATTPRLSVYARTSYYVP